MVWGVLYSFEISLIRSCTTTQYQSNRRGRKSVSHVIVWLFLLERIALDSSHSLYQLTAVPYSCMRMEEGSVRSRSTRCKCRRSRSLRAGGCEGCAAYVVGTGGRALCVGGVVEDALCAGVSEGCAACIVDTGGRGERALCAWISEGCAACVPKVRRCVL